MKPEIHSLRSIPTTLSYQNVIDMIQKHGFFERKRNPGGKGISHHYVSRNDEFVIDETTGLMWQRGVSGKISNREDVIEYINRLNRDNFSGFNNWRLPTLEELMSLMEPKQNKDGVYIDDLFYNQQIYIWSRDTLETAPRVWAVSFYLAECYSMRVRANSLSGVRFVRSWSSS